MLPLVKVHLPEPSELMPALEDVLYSGMIGEGEQVYRFEEAFGSYFSVPNLLAMSSGTAALHTALTLAGVGNDDEVISTPMTAEPTNTSILYCGAKIKWADVDPLSGNMDPQSVRQNITSKTKAILCVHYAGYPARINELRSIADEFGIKLIEDCAHALGATYFKKPIGSIGDYGIYSFQAIKHMTTIDGGAITMARSDQLINAKKFRWFGMMKGVSRTEIDIDSIGYKYNMNNVTATIGLIQLNTINHILTRHIENGRFYDHEFSNIPGVDFARVEDGANPSYWLYSLLSDSSNDIERILGEAKIHSSKLHRPNNLHTIFKNSNRPLLGVDKFYEKLLHIPCGWWVSDEDRQTIVDLIRKG